MGMYDTINGEQVKIFNVPVLDISPINSSIISFSGGSLSIYKKGEEVPYKTFWYDYRKDFNIIDFFPENFDDTVIHIIRDGINQGVVQLKNIKTDLFDFDCYDTKGQLIKIKSVEDIAEYIDKTKALSEAVKKKEKTAYKKLQKYMSTCKGDADYEEKYREYFYEYELENKRNKEMLIPFWEQLEAYVLPGNLSKESVEIGALIYKLSASSYKEILDPTAKFFVTDERLSFVVGYNRLKELVDMPDLLNKYFDEMKFDNEEVKEMLGLISDLEKLYNKIKRVELREEQFDAQYSLSDILDGVYKKYYLEYNILPYVDFDYSHWEVCVAEETERAYQEFNKKIDDYVQLRLNEER